LTAASDGTPILAAVGIRKRFGSLAVLDGVDFAVGADEAVGIVGPNGAGKTTLLNVLSGALRPGAGRVLLSGQDVTSSGAARRCRLGIGRAHQVPRPFGDMTVFENAFVGAATGGGLRRRAAYDRAIEALERCGMLDLANRRAESLGLLHRKQLELARALATGPSVLLLDEIGAGLTDAESNELVGTIQGIRAQGVAIVWIEHIVHVLVRVVGRLVCMDAGRVIADGTPAEVMEDARVIDAYFGTAVA
jgi:branched-chain amino acid transport system ATP-binding protein